MSRHMPDESQRADLALAQWKEERPDLDADAMALFGRIVEAAELLEKIHLLPFYKKHGLQRGEFDVLATLRRSGSPYALSPTDLYRTTMISSGGMTNRIIRLEKAGWVCRCQNPSDRRGVQVKLTEEGFAKIDAMLSEHVAGQKNLLSDLSVHDQKLLSDLLAGLIQTMTNVS